MRLVGASIMTAMGALAFGPAIAQVDPLAPLPQGRAIQAQARPTFQPVVIQPAQTIVSRPVYAAPTGFEGYKLRLAALARSQGVRESTIQSHVPGLDLNSRAIQLDRSQPGGNPAVASTTYSDFEPYRRSHVDAARINGGRRVYAQVRPIADQVEARYGVPASIVIAVVFSGLVGVFFGWYPALRASRLDPIEALRHT